MTGLYAGRAPPDHLRRTQTRPLQVCALDRLVTHAPLRGKFRRGARPPDPRPNSYPDTPKIAISQGHVIWLTLIPYLPSITYIY
jgi:hypothetical protein